MRTISIHVLRLAALLAIFLVGGTRTASAQKVLLIPDDDAGGTATLANALSAAGMTVTTAATPSYQYTGASPAPTGFDVLVLLAGGPGGNSANVDMPAQGQSAIASFVAAGGGLVNTEWSAFHVSQGRWQTLKPLVLLARSSGTTGSLDYTVAPGQQAHPLWSGLPNTFSFPSATNVGAVIPGPGVTRIATSALAGDGVAARDLLNNGRVVQISSAGNFAPGTFGDANLQRLIVNSCKWASASRMNAPPVASAGGPYAVDEGGTVQLSGTCTDPDMDAQSYSWDVTGNGVFGGLVGPKPTFSAAGLDGPKTITIALKCTDSGGLSNVATTQLTIRNVAPRFTSMPPTTATEGQTYSYAATVADPGANDMLTCSLGNGPSGMTVSSDCQVAWLPSYAQAIAGSAAVTLLVTDLANAQTAQSYTITVSWIDSDGDGLPDTWESLYFGNLAQGPADDPDADGRPNLKEFQDGTDPTRYDGPNSPTPAAPADGSRAPTVTPTLTVGNAVSPLGEALSYEFEVYGDKALTMRVDIVVQVPSGQGSTSTSIANPLLENHHYWWRARARDLYVAGPWSTAATFFVDAVRDAPTAPAISMPADLAHTPLAMPKLVVTDAKSPDEYPLTYTFELYSDGGLTQKVESMAAITEVAGSTSYAVKSKLADYTHYWWRARATDSMGLDGPWSSLASFEVVPGNPPPTDPKIYAPSSTMFATTLTPKVVVGASTDPDEEAVTYQCDLDLKNTFDTAQRQSTTGLKPDQTNQASWTPSPLQEDTRYYLRCRGRDASGTSAWVGSSFFVSVKNDAPSVPTLQNPSDGGHVAGGLVHFTWNDAVDPEGDSLRYEVEVYRDAKLKDRAAQATGGDGRVGVTLGELAPAGYWWRARAVDVSGAASGWANPNQFTVGDLADPGHVVPSGSSGCVVGGREGRPGALALLGLLVALGAAARRRRSR